MKLKVNMMFPTLALAVALSAMHALAEQNQPKPVKPSSGAQTSVMKHNMAIGCRQTMAVHDHMMADVEAMNTKLDRKVAAMNAATGNAKVDAMAAVLNEMVSQRKQMMAKMTEMRDQMMSRMGDRMARSGVPATRHPMAQCPMMGDMRQPPSPGPAAR